jgi:hypothetical protein
MRIENMQEELTRLHKTIAEKDELIILLKEVLTGKDKKVKHND